MAVDDVTVVIPLHTSVAWVDNVVGNVTRLGGRARIIISDPFEADAALATLRTRVGAVPHVVFAGRRPLAAGWPAHYNDLFARARTPLVMVLAHDDEIDALWVDAACAALAASPDAILAVGDLVDEADHARRIVLQPALGSLSAYDRVRAGSSLVVADGAALGVAMRGVFRREAALPVPVGIPGDEWADIYWAIAMLVRGRFVTIPGAEYRKRFRPDGTHLQWAPLDRRAMAQHLRDAIAAGADGLSREALLAAAWEGDRSHLLDEVDALRAHVAGLADQVERESRARACAQTQAGEQAEAARYAEAERERLLQALGRVHGSRTWRVTEPLRRLAARLRR